MTIEYQHYKSGDEQRIFELVKRVYDEFIAPDYSEEGSLSFYNWINPQAIAQRQQSHNNLIMACDKSKLVGVIEMRDCNHICLLFVDKLYQHRGLAKRLLAMVIEKIKLQAINMDKITVNASPYAIPVYRKLGFIETDVLREESGIKYLPMEKII
jgi:Acetyltransferases